MMAEVTRRAVEEWPVGEPFALWPRMQEITLDVVMRAVFGRNPDPRLDTLRQRLRTLTEWMNNPRKPMEASGTSGMKASINGVPHFSIGDGWWAEGYTGENGWIIEAADAPDPESQDAADAARMYEILEREIVPAFYERENGIPRGWLKFVRNAIVTVAARFSARRMVKDYVDNMYAPALKRLVNS